MTPPATPWTEMSVAETPYVEGFPSGPQQDMLFGVGLMTDSGVSMPAPTPYTEMSVAATSYTEMTAPATTWTEITG